MTIAIALGSAVTLFRRKVVVKHAKRGAGERLEVLADDGVEHGVPGVAGLIRAIVMAHTHG